MASRPVAGASHIGPPGHGRNSERNHPATAEALQLVPVGQTTVNHAGGCSQANTYVVNLILPNTVGFAGVLVSKCPDVAGDFGAIVGMDIISQADLAITNVAGQTVMSFRTPSIQPIDYVIEAHRTDLPARHATLPVLVASRALTADRSNTKTAMAKTTTDPIPDGD